MNRLVGLFSTSIGRKLMMAVTGVLLLGFLVAHMLGNMIVFQGQDALNAYADWLTGHPMLWIARAHLLAFFALHTYLGVRLATENRIARPTRYQHRTRHQASTPASRYMILTGLVVLAFVAYHLAHFTFGAVDPGYPALVDDQGRHDVYGMIVHGFRQPWIVGTYVVAMLLLGTHLIHGARSLFQTLGLNHESFNVIIRVMTLGLVMLIVLGNISIPLFVYFGLPTH